MHVDSEPFVLCDSAHGRQRPRSLPPHTTAYHIATARRCRIASSAMPVGGCGTVVCMRAHACPPRACTRARVSVACAPARVRVRVRRQGFAFARASSQSSAPSRISARIALTSRGRQSWNKKHAADNVPSKDCTGRIQHTTPATWQAYNRRGVVSVRPAEQDKRYRFPEQRHGIPAGGER